MGTIKLLGQIFDKALSTITVDSLSVSSIIAQTEYIDILKSTIHHQTNLINVALGVIASFVVLVVISQYKFWEKLKSYEDKFEEIKKWKIVDDIFQGFNFKDDIVDDVDRPFYLIKIFIFINNPRNKDIVDDYLFFHVLSTLIQIKERYPCDKNPQNLWWDFLKKPRFRKGIIKLRKNFPYGKIETKCNEILEIMDNEPQNQKSSIYRSIREILMKKKGK